MGHIQVYSMGHGNMRESPHIIASIRIDEAVDDEKQNRLQNRNRD